MNPIQSPQCCVDLGRKVFELLTGDELRTVNLDRLLLNVRCEVEALHGLRPCAVSRDNVKARPRLVKKCGRRAVGRKLVLHGAVASVYLDDAVDGLLIRLHRLGRHDWLVRVLRQVRVVPSRLVRCVRHLAPSLYEKMPNRILTSKVSAINHRYAIAVALATAQTALLNRPWRATSPRR